MAQAAVAIYRAYVPHQPASYSVGIRSSEKKRKPCRLVTGKVGRLGLPGWNELWMMVRDYMPSYLVSVLSKRAKSVRSWIDRRINPGVCYSVGIRSSEKKRKPCRLVTGKVG